MAVEQRATRFRSLAQRGRSLLSHVARISGLRARELANMKRDQTYGAHLMQDRRYELWS